MRTSRVVRDQEVARKGDLAALSAPPAGTRTLAASYRWPMQTHGSIGPSCGVADVRPERVTVWTASQNVHGLQNTFARVLGVERDRVRVIYMDGAGSYGANGADDAAMEAALLSRALGRPVRVQWTPAGGARARSEGPRPAPGPARGGGQGRRGGRVGDAGVAAHRHRQPAQHPAPVRGRGGPPADAGPLHRADLPERGSAVRDAEPERGGALDRGRAAPHLAAPRARQDRQHLRGGVVHRRDRRAGPRGSAGVPARRLSNPRASRRSGASPRAWAGSRGRRPSRWTRRGRGPHRPRARLRALQARRDASWRWAWRWRWSAPPAASA